jgi:hypothetical protein
MQSIRRRGSSLGAKVAQAPQVASSERQPPKTTELRRNKSAGFSKVSEFLS